MMHFPEQILFFAFLIGVLHSTAACGSEENTQAARDFIQYYEETVRPLEIQTGEAWWNANVSGDDEDFAVKETLQNRLNELLSSKQSFEKLEKIKQGKIDDPQVERQIDILYLTYLGKQVDLALLKRITSLENTIEKRFNVYRAQVGEEFYTDSQVREVLSNSKDLRLRQQVWEASKGVGREVEGDLRDLIARRNQAAKQLGFSDYHDMMLTLNEQDQDEVLALFDELDKLTREPFRQAKERIDRVLADDYGIEVDELRAWHYHDPFFQESQKVYPVDIDAAFAKADILQICRDFYSGIGLPIDDVLERSSLYEQPGKSPHAFCTDIDRRGDVRVLANIKPNEYWMGTMLHELGHAVYSSKFIPMELPYILRVNSHILTTEGVAMMFERFIADAEWLAAFGLEIENPEEYTETARQMRRDQLLIFSRWCQVMLRFEMEMYKNPEQNLNKLWWDLVEEYQGIKPPEDRDAPDFASKIHVVSAPAYYHNYMMGQLFACQVHATIVRELGIEGDPAHASYTSDPRVGEFMQEKIFDPGASLPWNELTKHATGEELNAEAFAAEFQE